MSSELLSALGEEGQVIPCDVAFSLHFRYGPVLQNHTAAERCRIYDCTMYTRGCSLAWTTKDGQILSSLKHGWA